MSCSSLAIVYNVTYVHAQAKVRKIRTLYVFLRHGHLFDASILRSLRVRALLRKGFSGLFFFSSSCLGLSISLSDSTPIPSFQTLIKRIIRSLNRECKILRIYSFSILLSLGLCSNFYLILGILTLLTSVRAFCKITGILCNFNDILCPSKWNVNYLLEVLTGFMENSWTIEIDDYFLLHQTLSALRIRKNFRIDEFLMFQLLIVNWLLSRLSN